MRDTAGASGATGGHEPAGARSVGVLGASGYAGAELLRLLARHPDLEVSWAAGDSTAGQPLAARYPCLAAAYGELTFCSVEEGLDKGADAVFMALPHGRSAAVASSALAVADLVVDLSADFRLRDPAAYPAWYGAEHPSPEELGSWPYGLPELHREELRGATKVAVPGCYPTAALRALAQGRQPVRAGERERHPLRRGPPPPHPGDRAGARPRRAPAAGGGVRSTPGADRPGAARHLLRDARARRRRSRAGRLPGRCLFRRAVRRSGRSGGPRRHRGRLAVHASRRHDQPGAGRGRGRPGGAVRQPGARPARDRRPRPRPARAMSAPGAHVDRGLGVTAAAGFTAAGAACGIKPSGGLDLALVVGRPGTIAAGTFTTNQVVAAPVVWSRRRLAASADARVVVVNSGNANACTGEAGEAAVLATVRHAAAEVGCAPEQVLACSTGVIGLPLEVDKLTHGIAKAARDLGRAGGEAAAEAIRTTDTVSKQAGVVFGGVTVAGMAKGAAMLAPALDPAGQMLADAEGGTKVFSVHVGGAGTVEAACAVARRVADSPLVKTAVYGGDPNWGRILQAAGADASAAFAAREVEVRLHLGGTGPWACVRAADLTPEYVRLNSEHTT